MNNKPGILYLDDEENNLFSFRALFRRDFDIYTTTSAAEAIQILRENDIQVVLSDQKMAEISGVEFFELLRNEFPDPVRILVTGYADIEAVIDAINKGQVYRYITKPWNEQDLKFCIENAYEKYSRERELRTKNVELEKANAELDKFVYSTSHDLRAPLVSMLGIMEVLRVEEDKTKSREYIDMLDTTLQRLNEAVQNIIYYYQNARNQELLEEIKWEFFLDEVMRQARKSWQGVPPTLNLDISSSNQFVCDRHRLKVIVLNILSNAIRYADSEKSEMWIRIEVIQNAEKAIVRISDNGLGIENARLNKIFDAYDGHSMSGGIGLYIARQAATKIGAELHVHSIFGEGSKFTIDIPNRI